MSLIDEAALEALIRKVAREEAARPLFVHQRTVETIVGLPKKDYLRLARAGAFPVDKITRLVFAKTEDVAAYIEAHRHPAPVSHQMTEEDLLLARVGARRVRR